MTNTTRRIMFFNKFSAFTSLASSSGINFMITTFYRTKVEQKKRFDEGNSQRDGTIKKSSHQKWLAIDIVIVNGGKLVWKDIPAYQKLGSIWKILGGVWGGDWKNNFANDIYHFQYGGE